MSGPAVAQPATPPGGHAPGGSRPSMRKAMEVFSYRNYRVLWISTLFAFVGMQMQQVSRALLAWELTESFGAVGAIALSFGLPMLLFSLVGGSLADRFEKRNLTLMTQTTTGVLMLLNAILVATDTITFEILFFLGFIQGTFFALGTPARTPLMAEAVGPDKIMSAIAMSNAAMNFTRLLGPAVVGVLVSVSNLSTVYFAQAVLFGVSAVLLLLVPTGLKVASAVGPAGAVRRKTNMFKEMGLGIGYVVGHPRLRLLIGMMFVITMIGMPYVLLLPGFVQEDLGRSESAYGWLQSVTGIGALVASLGVATFTEFDRKPLVQWLAGMLSGASLILLALGSAAFGFTGAVGAVIVLGFVFTAYQTLNNTMVMGESDPEYYGRVMSINLITFSGMSLMATPMGFVADLVGPESTFIIMGGVILSIMLLLGLANRGYTFGRSSAQTFTARQAHEAQRTAEAQHPSEPDALTREPSRPLGGGAPGGGGAA